MLTALRMPWLALQSNAGATTIAIPRFPWAWFGIAVIFATLWTAVVLTQNNLEMQSIDLCHHAMFVDHVQVPWGAADVAFVWRYPLLSHRVATLWLPLFHNPIQAVRAAALASLLVMLISQWYLLRTRLSPAVAMLVLVGWQTLCTSCKLGDVNHFMWDFQYNYSRAVSAAAMWVMILTFAVPPSRWRIVNLAIALGLAAFAFRCHIAAGSLALAALGTWCTVNVLRRDWLMGLGGLISLAITGGALLLFTDEWRYLASLSNDNCLLPIRHPDLIVLWIPTAAIGLGIALWKSYKAIRSEGLAINLTVAALCGLLPAASLQSYMLYGKNVTGTVGAYPYNQMLFYTFGLATLLWFAGLIEVWNWLPQPQSRPWKSLDNVAAVAAAIWGMFVLLEADAKRDRVDHDRDPVVVVHELRQLHDQFIGHYYYDPPLELGCYFITRDVLGRDSYNAARYRLHLHQRKPWELFTEPELRGLFLPASVDPKAILGPHCPAERVGPFWKCDLESYRKSPEFDRFIASIEKRS